jgi:nucleotide-binding universal stress UspA family protein
VRWRKKVVTKERTMFTNILIPTDGSELAGQAVPYGIALTKRIGQSCRDDGLACLFHVRVRNLNQSELVESQFRRSNA